MSAEPRERSGANLGEPVAPRRRTKFDRSRSRSPVRENADETHRSRSPVAKTETVTDDKPATPRIDPSQSRAKAMEIAAKLSAAMAAKGGNQKAGIPWKLPKEKASEEPKDDVYQQNGDYMKDIDINDFKTKFTLTKGDVQHKITTETGADVTTRGAYYPDRSMATLQAPCLHLHVTATTRESLDKAVAMIEEMLNQELPNLIDERRFKRRGEQEVDERGFRKWPKECVSIDLEPIPGFNLRAAVVGERGSYVKHIQQQTGCRVQIKGRGSGFLERDTNEESDEAMYLEITASNPVQVEAGKAEALSLVEAIKKEYYNHKEGRGQSNNNGRDQELRNQGGQDSRRGGRDGGRDRRGGGGGGGFGGRGDYYDHDNQQGNGATGAYDKIEDPLASANGYTGQGAFGTNQTDYAYGQQVAAQPTYDVTTAAAQAAGMDVTTYQAWVAHYAANPGEDHYAPQGGFQTYMEHLAAYMMQSNPGYPTGATQGYAQGYSATTQDQSQAYGGYNGYPAGSYGYTADPSAAPSDLSKPSEV
ncbi:hypothetical protein AMS68_002481 [Peltaster fructicola]|uniref:K Homology domain-containing protein n=1 Tax=Peltaster fructicola TaxID=286661 RepID=A0A6H0XQF8_9PEZI|nr:hypothetical protein AMS68_002481 [Peltaster fructicola]